MSLFSNQSFVGFLFFDEIPLLAFRFFTDTKNVGVLLDQWLIAMVIYTATVGFSASFLSLRFVIINAANASL